MILDIILLILVLVFALIGYKKGFMRSILSILKGATSLIIAILVSKPIATVFDKLFGLGKTIGKLFTSTIEKLGTDPAWFTAEAVGAATGDQINTIKGTDFISTILERIVRNIIKGAGDGLQGNSPLSYACTVLGFFALIVLTAILVFLLVRLLLRVLDRFIKKLTEENTGFRLDAWLGALFGIIRFFVTIMCWMVFLVVLTTIPFLNNIAQWLFSGSVICNWLYEMSGQLVIWFFQTFDIVAIVVNALGLG